VLLPGLNGASLYDVSRFFFREMNDSNLLERADLVTFSFILAIPPTFLFLFSLVPFLHLGNSEQTILKTLKMVTPNNKIYHNVEGVITDFMHKQHHSVLSFGIILTLYYASNGMGALMKSFDRSLTLYRKRSFLNRKWKAVKLTLILMSVLVATIGVMVLQNKSINKLLTGTFHNMAAARTLSYTTLFLVMFVAISIIYTYGPSLTHRFKFVSAGSVFATLGSILGTAFFFFLVNNFLNYNKVYGSIGSLIAFMAWLWYNTIVLLIGYDLNVSILLGKLSQEEPVEIVE
jgi:membrane protein